MDIKPKIIFISWAPYCSRSDNIARELGGKSYMVYYDCWGSNYLTILFKYLMQSIRSLFILFQEKPDVVFVMSPPIIACAPVFLYKIFCKRIKIVIDAHTAAFTHQRWAKKDQLNSFFTSRAAFTIVTNANLGKIVNEKWNGAHEVVTDVPIKFIFSTNQNVEMSKRSKIITLVNTFAPDEPLINFLEAVVNLPGIQVFITGKIKTKDRKIISSQPSHVIFTDFLTDMDYAQLLKQSDIICALTTRDNTMQRGAYEAIYLGKPIITSNWNILRDNFPIGAVHVDNTPNAIFDGILYAIKNLNQLTEDAAKLRERKLEIWLSVKKKIMTKLQHY